MPSSSYITLLYIFRYVRGDLNKATGINYHGLATGSELKTEADGVAGAAGVAGASGTVVVGVTMAGVAVAGTGATGAVVGVTGAGAGVVSGVGLTGV
jgi:hypothetical protein